MSIYQLLVPLGSAVSHISNDVGAMIQYQGAHPHMLQAQNCAQAQRASLMQQNCAQAQRASLMQQNVFGITKPTRCDYCKTDHVEARTSCQSCGAPR